MGGEHGDGNHTTKSSFLLGGLTCDTCVRIIENRLLDLHGVKNVQVGFSTLIKICSPGMLDLTFNSFLGELVIVILNT